MRFLLVAMAVAAGHAALSAASDQESETVTFTSSSDTFLGSASSSIELLRKDNFLSGLESPALNAKTSEEFAKLVKEINAETPIPDVARGAANVQYDVVLQPGHYGRKTGKVGTAGKLVSERALVAFVAGQIAAELRRKGFKVLVVSADSYIVDDQSTPAWEGLSAKTFVAIHADGNVKACSTGPSLGYSPGTSPHAMHAIGLAISQALGYKYADFMKDNFTANESKYYMFQNVKSDGLKGLLEIGELTCEADEKSLVEHSTLLAGNIAHAVNFILTLPSQ